MSEEARNDQMPAYTQAVRSGLYAKKSGLVGKYDNVRLYWEEEITRQFLRPHLLRLITLCRATMRRLRIMDLGCGSADGYELLAGVRHRDADLQDVEVDLLTPDVLGLYKGIDLNEDLRTSGFHQRASSAQRRKAVRPLLHLLRYVFTPQQGRISCAIVG